MTTLVAAAIVRRADEILITRRSQETDFGGFWEFPGGKLEEGESPEEALKRECLEEIGAEVKVGSIFEASFARYTHKSVLLLFYQCELLSGAEVQNLQVSEHKWVNPSELVAEDFPPANHSLIQKLQATDTQSV